MEDHIVYPILVIVGGSVLLIVSKGNLLVDEKSNEADLVAEVGYIIPILRHLSSLNDILEFTGYGCWCGSAHSGETVDEIDSCCKSHFHCYKMLVHENKCTSSAKQYSFTLCPGDVTCQINEDICTRRSCECDVALGKCILNNISKYSEEYGDHNQTLCIETPAKS